ncbi:MAG: ADP/ATP-dependent (S)-NAD(P)H-hydrate dehydratase [Patescibacteria group bacterium]|jgi:NAD(P)H-hydrate epimerase
MKPIKDFNKSAVQHIKKMAPRSHKGDNGKVLVIGGSELFHSASLWAAELVAHFVDHVFYYSPNSINRDILTQNKKRFLNGIVVLGEELEEYVKEADVVLIGPGLRRQNLRVSHDYSRYINATTSLLDINDEGLLSYFLVNTLVAKYPLKKWVVDAGALQELELTNITDSCILTPHQQEFYRLFPRKENSNFTIEEMLSLVKDYHATWLLKRQGTDYVYYRNHPDVVRISGGNSGLTKGGTGDLLAALVASLYVNNDSVTSASIASYVIKKTAELLYETKGPYFTTTELLVEIPGVLWSESQNPSVKL